MTMFITNAIIEDAKIGLDNGTFLTVWLYLDYGGKSQGFGGYVLGATKDAKAGEHTRQPNICAEFVVRCLEAAGVDDFAKLKGKAIRVRKEKEYGPVIAIGHITKDDLWFDPAQVFANMMPKDTA